MTKARLVPLDGYIEYTPEQMLSRAKKFYEDMKRRRTVREFSDKPVPRELIEQVILTAGTAPSGANMQPWHFVVVSNTQVKKEIRQAAEEVEKEFYEQRAPDYWLRDLEHLATDSDKPHLEQAPYLIVVFSQRHKLDTDGAITHHYYLAESVGISMGMLITAIHQAGLVSLTHTPHPMSFLRKLLNRPKHETPVLILAVGYPKDGARVPDISKKNLNEIATFV